MVIAFNRQYLGMYSFSNLLNFVKLYKASIFTNKVPRPKCQESKITLKNEFENRSLVQESDGQVVCATVVILSNDPTSLQAQVSHLPLSLPEPVFIIPSPLWFPQQQSRKCAKYSR